MEPVWSAVGRALSQWEHAESGLTKLFQVFCETKSLAACRALGTIESAAGRYYAVRFAGQEFFAARDPADLKVAEDLLREFNKALEYRNRIAHGMVVQPHAFGYFVCPTPDTSKKFGTPYPSELWGLKADYFYTVDDLANITQRFEEILRSIMALLIYLIEKYKVLEYADLHP